MAIAGYWAVAGLYTDAGWHIRHDVDTFLTWAHAILYSGLALLLGILTVMYLDARRKGVRDPRTIFGAAYGWSAIGALIFLAGGIADMINHLYYGFEGGFDALLAPTHQLIGVGVLLIIAGPIRSAVTQKPRPATLRDQLPAVIAAAAIMELIHWGTQVFFRVDAARSLGIVVPHALTADAITLSTMHFFQQGGSLIAVILQSLLMLGLALYLVRNFQLRPGALTALFLLGNGLIAITHAISLVETFAVVVASIIAGIAGDVFLAGGPITATRLRYESFAFAVPVAYTTALVLFTIIFMGGIWWDPIFAAGAIFYSGLFALLLSFVAYPEPWTSASP